MSTLYVEEMGSPGAAAVVFLHGVGVSGRMWAGHMARLAAYHCLAPDLPGFGRSRALRWRSREHTAELVAALIATRTRTGRAHVVGLSLGGTVAHTLLARRPELLESVVIDEAGVLPAPIAPLAELGVALVAPFLHTRAVVAAIGRAFSLDAWGRRDLRVASRRAFLRAVIDANDTVITPGEVAAPCRTLLVAGERGFAAVRASNAALAALMPHAEARYVARRGHGWIGQLPELHQRMVAAWIRGDALPPELLPETTPWPVARVHALLGRAAPPRAPIPLDAASAPGAKSAHGARVP